MRWVKDPHEQNELQCVGKLVTNIQVSWCVAAVNEVNHDGKQKKRVASTFVPLGTRCRRGYATERLLVG